MTIDQTAAQVALTKLQFDWANTKLSLDVDVTALTAIINGTPPFPQASPDGATIMSPPDNHMVIDALGHVFSFGTGQDANGYAVMRDGTHYLFGQAKSLTMMSGACWAFNNAGQWFRDSGASWDFQVTGPNVVQFPSTTTLPPPPPPPPLPALDDSVPQAAIDAGMTVLNWEVRFGSGVELSRIDTANVGTPTAATDLYLSDTYGGPAAVITADDLSVDANGVLTINKSRAGASYGTNYPTLQSVFYDAKTPGVSTHGRYFKNGWYLDCDFTFDQSLAAGGNGFPAVWLSNFWDGQNHYMEIDAFEFFPKIEFMAGAGGPNGSQGFFTHEYQNNAAGVGQVIASTYPPGPAYPQPTFADLGNPKWDGTDYHNVGHLWTTMAQGGAGVGTFSRFFDRKEFAPDRLTYSTAAAPSYGTQTVGAFSICENPDPKHKGFGLYITCGNSGGDTPWPFKLRRIRVFQRSAADMTVVG